MSKNWAERQCRTNQLVRVLAKYIFKQKNIQSEQHYGLCKLTWITKSFDTFMNSILLFGWIKLSLLQLGE